MRWAPAAAVVSVAVAVGSCRERPSPSAPAGGRSTASACEDVGMQETASGQGVPVTFRARVLALDRLEGPASARGAARGYVVDEAARWDLRLEVPPHSRKTPFQPGVRRCLIADAERVFGVAADEVRIGAEYEFSFTWNVDVSGKPMFEAFRAAAR